MKKVNSFPKPIVYAGIMGIATCLLCLALADGILGLNRYGGSVGRGIPGAIVFWIFLLGLPPLFSQWTKWRYTLINFPIYFFLYFPLAEFFGYEEHHVLLKKSGFLSFPDWCNALVGAVIFFTIQSLVFLVFNIVVCFFRKEKNSKTNSQI